MPPAPKKAKTPTTVPGQGDPDRKRVLNVLAQRRYRQRRKEKLAALESRAGSTSALESERSLLRDEPRVPRDTTEACLLESMQEDYEIVGDVDVSSSGHFSSMVGFDLDSFDTNVMQSFDSFPGLPSPIPSTPCPPSPQPFMPLAPDGAILEIPTLGAMRAFLHVALAFDVVTHIYDRSYLHVLPPLTPAMSALPANLHPTSAQLTIPHHPMLDLLPWPNVREKLICMLSMPSAFRPPIAREDDGDEMPTTCTGKGVQQSRAITRLVEDLDDPQDGVGLRVHGNTTTWSEGNELIEDAWEIGELFFQKWWWCLDQKIVETSNRRRRERGLPRLTASA